MEDKVKDFTIALTLFMREYKDELPIKSACMEGLRVMSLLIYSQVPEARGRELANMLVVGVLAGMPGIMDDEEEDLPQLIRHMNQELYRFSLLDSNKK